MRTWHLMDYNCQVKISLISFFDSPLSSYPSAFQVDLIHGSLTSCFTFSFMYNFMLSVSLEILMSFFLIYLISGLRRQGDHDISGP